MGQLLGDKRVLVVGLLVVVFGGVYLWLNVLATHKKGDFVEALTGGAIDNLPLELQGKTWSEKELAEVTVMRLSQDGARQRSLARRVHSWNATLSPAQHSYEAVITDGTSGKKYVFGRLRSSGRWVSRGLHPDSIVIRQNPYYQDPAAPTPTGNQPTE